MKTEVITDAHTQTERATSGRKSTGGEYREPGRMLPFGHIGGGLPFCWRQPAAVREGVLIPISAGVNRRNCGPRLRAFLRCRRPAICCRDRCGIAMESEACWRIARRGGSAVRPSQNRVHLRATRAALICADGTCDQRPSSGLLDLGFNLRHRVFGCSLKFLVFGQPAALEV